MTIAETPRLLVRRIGVADRDDLLAVYGDADAMKWVGDGTPLSADQCDQWMAVTQRNYEQRGYGMFAIELRTTGRVAGFIGLVHPGGHPIPELKYALKREAWKMGYATEAAKAVLRYAVSIGLREVVAIVAPDNEASMAVLLKAGMTTGGLRVDDDGEYSQVFVWRSLAR